MLFAKLDMRLAAAQLISEQETLDAGLPHECPKVASPLR